MSYTIGLISLGCPKNQVDAEMMLASLENAGFQIVDYVDGADAVIINTCGFIDDAKKEAIENILDMGELKKEGIIKKVIVTGCLAERYHGEILNEMPEIDAVIGIGANGDIADICKRVIEGESISVFPEKENLPLDGQRLLTTPEHWAYIKIAEGCSNRCSYCAIPDIRGNFRSRPMESIIEEARQLAITGIKELVVVAQDTTRYGEDLYGELKLPELLNQMCEIDGIEWIRLLYCYPERITDELLNTIAEQEKIVHYLDLPIQHADDKILKAMNRKSTNESLYVVLEKIKEKVPDMAIRTTVMTGFPGEDEEAFNNLAEFVVNGKFTHLGCFTFSPQENTPAAKMDYQVAEKLKMHRAELIMEQQMTIVERNNSEKIGSVLKVIVEGYDGYTDTYYGRSYMDAPEIDGSIFFTSDENLNDGDFVNVEVLGISDTYDLLGEMI